MSAAADKPRRPAISRERVIEAAIEVIDERGVEGLTMRRLGAALSADPMSAYLHVRNKAELLDAVVEHQAARLASWPEIDADDPVEIMIQIARHYRAVLLEHPRLAPLIASRPLQQAAAAETVAIGVRLFEWAGYDAETLPVAFDALVTFGFGFVLQEALRVQRRAEFGVSFEDQQLEVLEQIRLRDEDTTIAESIVLRRLQPGSDDDEFVIGLRGMLRGLAAGLGAPPPEP